MDHWVVVRFVKLKRGIRVSVASNRNIPSPHMVQGGRGAETEISSRSRHSFQGHLLREQLNPQFRLGERAGPSP